MNIPLFKVPDDVLKCILEKTTFQALCRLRKSHKRLDTVAEENRFSIRAVADEDYDEEQRNINGILETNTTRKELIISFCDSTQSILEHEDKPLILDDITLNTERSSSVEDLKRLQLECDLLHVSGYLCDGIGSENILSSIKFYKLRTSGVSPVNLRFLHHPLIQHCVYVSIHLVSEVPEDVSTVLRHVQIRTIEPNCFYQKEGPFISSVIAVLKKDRIALGGIKHLRFLRLYPTNFISKYIIWSGDVASYIYQEDEKDVLSKDKISFYFVEVDGGIMFMTYDDDCFQMSFFEDNIRERIAWRIISVLMKWTPCDLSFIWDNLVNASDLPGAIDTMLKGFKADYLYEPRNNY